ncbi:MAG: MarR family transcriptional regulator [Emcibacteraceae bacterium]|nr:MarR family transcriptional regulator [Emcibacteraceae bacterium]
MTDINFKNINDEQLFLKSTELLYFAYRDYIAWPDEVLQNYGFGRAHHRVLFFVNQTPGMTVAQLLKMLNITKQSLSRVLSTLIDKGYVIQEIGDTDRRKRLLDLTDKGKKLLNEVSEHQKVQMVKACKDSGIDSIEGFWKVLSALINEENRQEIISDIFKSKDD